MSRYELLEVVGSGKAFIDICKQDSNWEWPQVEGYEFLLSQKGKASIKNSIFYNLDGEICTMAKIYVALEYECRFLDTDNLSFKQISERFLALC